MKRIILVLLMSFLASCDLVHTNINIPNNSIKSIYDGDTITLKCMRDFKCHKNALKVRIMGVDTPEIKGKCRKEKVLARKAKQFTVAFVRTSGEIVLSYDEYNKYDRYGRLLAYLSVDGKDLSESLIENKLGRRYDGGKRRGWC
jgi:endonuclease YncB( thermonuclease family)